MERVSMNDGLEGRETIAFGLGVAEVAVLVLALVSAYALVRSPLPAAIAWLTAVLVGSAGAGLGWGRLAGRPLLEWAILLATFLVRTRTARANRARQRLRGWTASARAAADRLRLHVVPAMAAVPAGQEGALVVPLALRRVDRTGPAVASARSAGRSGSHVVAFFSLAGGSGRTALAVEVAALLAMRGRAAAAAGASSTRVVLLDLAARNPSAGLRLGLVGADPASAELVTHPCGLLVGLAPASPSGDTPERGALALIDDARAGGADVVIVDIDCDPNGRGAELLRRCDQVLVTLTPTATGVLDAYRSTALLRGLGLRSRIGHVVNRWRPGVDLDEVMADLGGEVLAEVPDDHAFVEAENHHRLAALDGGAQVAGALERLAAAITREAAASRGLPGAPRWGSHAG